jgi:prepilin-type processing-associated H-X9-DG protein
MSVNGRWLDNAHHHCRDSPWITYGKLSTIRAPGPAMLWVLLDEDLKDLNDAAFGYGMERAVWYDVPGTFHDSGCGFAFADGHSEFHKWQYHAEKHGWGFVITDPADLNDWLWMRPHTSAHISGTMPPPR